MQTFSRNIKSYLKLKLFLIDEVGMQRIKFLYLKKDFFCPISNVIENISLVNGAPYNYNRFL